MYDEYLAHYGVKGMKWGKRKVGNRMSMLNRYRYPHDGQMSVTIGELKNSPELRERFVKNIMNSSNTSNSQKTNKKKPKGYKKLGKTTTSLNRHRYSSDGSQMRVTIGELKNNKKLQQRFEKFVRSGGKKKKKRK